MFWAVILIVMALVIGAAVMVGVFLNKRSDPRQLSNQEKMTLTKASGALKHRKSNRP